MSVSEKKKEANARWDVMHMATLGCRVRREDAAAFKRLAEARDTSANTLIKEYIMKTIGKIEESPNRVLCRSLIDGFSEQELGHVAQILCSLHLMIQ